MTHSAHPYPRIPQSVSEVQSAVFFTVTSLSQRQQMFGNFRAFGEPPSVLKTWDEIEGERGLDLVAPACS